VGVLIFQRLSQSCRRATATINIALAEDAIAPNTNVRLVGSEYIRLVMGNQYAQHTTSIGATSRLYHESLSTALSRVIEYPTRSNVKQNASHVTPTKGE